jgi:hypothetical protein
VEQYIELRAHNLRSLVLKPASNDELVRVHTDGFVTFHSSGELFAAVDGWGGYFDSAEELNHLAYILKEVTQTEVTEEGVDCFIVVEFGRIKTFLRGPDGPESPVFLYSNGMVSLAPEDVVFAQVRDWEEEDVWRLEQMAQRHSVEVRTRSDGGDELDFPAFEDADGDDLDFW